MLARRKPLEAEAQEFHIGMKHILIAQCKGGHPVVVFDNMEALLASPNYHKIKKNGTDFTMGLLVNNKPVAIAPGDYVIDGEVWTKKDFDKEWEVFKKPGPGRKPGFSPKKKNFTKVTSGS